MDFNVVVTGQKIFVNDDTWKISIKQNGMQLIPISRTYIIVNY